MLTMKSLATYAYAEMIRRADELQTRIMADEERLKTFGHNAIPAAPFRRRIHHNNVMSLWDREHRKGLERDKDELDNLLIEIAELETLFAEQHRQDSEAFGRGIAEYMRRQMSKEGSGR